MGGCDAGSTCETCYWAFSRKDKHQSKVGTNPQIKKHIAKGNKPQATTWGGERGQRTIQWTDTATTPFWVLREVLTDSAKKKLKKLDSWLPNYQTKTMFSDPFKSQHQISVGQKTLIHSWSWTVKRKWTDALQTAPSCHIHVPHHCAGLGQRFNIYISWQQKLGKAKVQGQTLKGRKNCQLSFAVAGVVPPIWVEPSVEDQPSWTALAYRISDTRAACNSMNCQSHT